MVISKAWDKYYVLTIYYLQIGSNGSPVILYRSISSVKDRATHLISRIGN